MGCTRRVRDRLSVYVEEFVSPLSAVAKAVYAIITYIDPNSVYQVAGQAWRGVSELSRIPSAIKTVYQSKETKTVVIETLKSNFVYSLLPMMLSSGVFEPLRQAYAPRWSAPVFWYVNFIFVREALRCLFLYAPIYNACLPQALNKDLELMLSQDIAALLKCKFAKPMDAIFSEPSVSIEIGMIKEKFSDIICESLSKEFTKAALKVFSDSAILEKSYAEKIVPANFKSIYTTALVKAFSEFFVEKNVASTLHYAIDKLFLTLDLKKMSGIDVLKKEIHVRMFLNKNLDEISKSMLKLSMTDFAAKLYTYIHRKSSKTERFLALLPSENFYAREHSISEMVYTRLMNPFYYLFSLRAQYALTGLHPYAGKLFEALLTGLLLMDLKFSSVGMGREQRYEIISKNKTYCFGLGATMIGLVDLASFLIGYLPGGDQWCVPFAIYYPLYQLFSIATLLQNERLPGQEDGMDAFYFNRIEADRGVSKLTDYLVPKLKDKKFRQELFESFNHPLIMNMRILFAGGKMKSLEALVKIPAFNLFLKLYGRDTLESLKHVEDLRSSRVLPFMRMLLSFFSGIIVSKHVPGVLGLVQDDNVNDAIQKFKELVILAERHREETYVLDVDRRDGFWDFAKDLHAWQDKEKKEVNEEKVEESKDGDVEAKISIQKDFFENKQATVLDKNLSDFDKMYRVEPPEWSLLKAPKKLEEPDDFEEIDYKELCSLSPLQKNGFFPATPRSAKLVSHAQKSRHVRMKSF